MAKTKRSEFLPRDAFTGGKVLSGFNYLYGWDIVPELLSLSASSQMNRARDEQGHFFVEVAQAFTVGVSLTKKLGLYVEAYGIMPAGANDPETGPVYYSDGGFTYKITPNFQVDIRVGIGLNRHADDFFTGTGFAVRY